MNFKYPFFLYLLLAIIIPLIIHLINLRKHKKILFSNVKLLKSIKYKKSSYKRIKDVFLMLARIATIIFLVFAFSQPFKKNKNKNSYNNNNTIIYIDNSPSMTNTIKNKRLIDIAKTKAIEIQKQNKNEISIITNECDFLKSIEKEDFIRKVNEIKISYQEYSFKSIMSKIKKHKNLNQSKIYFISDFQKNVFNVKEMKEDSLLDIKYIQIKGESKNNISLDSCWTEPKIQINKNNKIYIQITNHGEKEKKSIPIKLHLNNNLNSISNVDLDKGETKTIEIDFSTNQAGWNHGYISIKDYPLNHDDKIYFSFKIHKTKKVLSVYDKKTTDNIYNIFKNEKTIKYDFKNINQLNYNSLTEYDVIILNEIEQFNTSFINKIKTYTSNKKTLIIIPSQDIIIDSYNKLLKEINVNQIFGIIKKENKIKKLNLKSELYKDVFKKTSNNNKTYPVIEKYYKTKDNNKLIKEDLIILENGESLMSKYFYKSGEIYLLKSGLGKYFGDFQSNALIVPTFYNIVLHSTKQDKIYHNLKNNLTLKFDYIKNKNQKFEIQDLLDNISFIPRVTQSNINTKFETLNQIKENGHYKITSKDTNIIFSINHNRSESKQEYISKESLDEKIDFQKLQEKNSIKNKIKKRQPLWKYCIIIVIIFMTTELILIKL